jgi:hypothetical protein
VLAAVIVYGFKAQGSRLKAQGSRLKAQGSRLKAQGESVFFVGLALCLTPCAVHLYWLPYALRPAPYTFNYYNFIHFKGFSNVRKQ